MNTTSIVGERWYVIRAKTKQDNRAESNLRSWGIETFAPRVRELSRRAGGVTSYVIAPLFPGYLFARFDAMRLLSKVRLTRGVHSVLGYGEMATPVDDDAIAMIQSRLSEDGIVHLDGPRPGDIVEVVHGPLRTLVGVFDSALSGGDRVRILLMSITYAVHIELPKAFIRKLPAVQQAS